MDKKQKLRARKMAYQIWSRSEGKVRYIRISNDTGLTRDEILYYKKKDKWADRLKKDKKENKTNEELEAGLQGILYQPESVSELDDFQSILDKSGLTDQRKLFIMYYLQSYNVKWSAMQSGYSKHSANVRGATVMRDPKVIKTINKIKGLMHNNIYIKAHDIIDEYVKIAFADITEFVEFADNKVTLKPSTSVDGRLITEVKQGREGISLKMADKMKALERLEKLFEIMPDRRLELDSKKFDLTKELSKKVDDGTGRVTIINDIG